MIISLKNKCEKKGILIVLIFFLSLFFRFLKLLIDPLLSRDASLYLSLAENWNETASYSQTFNNLSYIVPPLPLWLTKTGLQLGFPAEVFARTLGLYLGALIPVIGFLTVQKISNNIRVSIISALLLAINPNLVYYSIQPLREVYYLFFCVMLLSTLVSAIKFSSLKDWILCGIYTSCGFFCRYEAFEFIIICPCILIILRLTHRIINKRFVLGLFLFFFSTIITCIILLFITTGFDASFLLKALSYIFKRGIPGTNV